MLIYLFSSIYFGTNVWKWRKKKNLNYSQRFGKYIKCHKDFNTLKLYTLKPLLNRNWFYFLFLILRHAKVPPSIGIPRYWNSFFTYLFFKFFEFFKFNMLDKKVVLIRLKVKIICSTKKLFWIVIKIAVVYN